MKIKRLEIQGFKSFADRVVLDFQQGVTGVVGPNGCGKSNIVDAIRWCMGEQSAKNLRGKAMEDVIFAGSDSRKPLGMAEVTLVFSTEDGRAPAKYLEFAEIQLTRRLYRDGESDYLINKTPCRLMDITELFMDTGVGTKAYSIIEQGKIGQVLHSRPEERRLLIEEAAGVTKFKARKQLALRKIEGTRQNLARLNDVIAEIRRQLNSLQRQAKKAEKFRELRDELREIDLLFAVHALGQLLAGRRAAEQELTVLNERLRAGAGAGAAAEAQVEQCRLALAEVEQQLATVQEESYRVRSDAATVESGLGFRRKEFDGLGDRLARLDGELAAVRLRREELQGTQQDLAQRGEGLRQESTAAEQRLQEHQERQQLLERAFEEATRLLESRRVQLFSAVGVASQCRTRIETAKTRMITLAERQERQSRELQQLTGRLEELAHRRDELATALEEKTVERGRAEQELSRLAGEEQRLNSRLPETERLWQARRDQLSVVSSRLTSLLELEAQFAGYGGGVRALLKDSPLRSRLQGLLADALEVDEECEAALEAVLADRLQLILCEQEDDLLASLEHLRRSGAGRAQLALPVAAPQEPEPLAGELPLISRIGMTPQADGLVRRLLAGVYLVDDLARALELARRHPELSFVTRSGELAALGGVVTGGSAEAVQAGIIHKKREIKGLEAERAQLEEAVEQLQQERDDLRLTVQQVARDLLASRSGLHRLELDQAGLQKDLQQVELENGRLQERIRTHGLEQAHLEEERAALEDEQEQAAEALVQAEEQTHTLERGNGEAAADLEERRGVLDGAREELTVLRVAAATLREQAESVQRSLVGGQQQVADLEERLRNGEQEQAECHGQRQQLTGAIADEEQRLQGLLAVQIELDAGLKAVRERYEQAGMHLAESEAAAKVRREENDGIRQQQSELTLRCSSLGLQLEHLEQSIRDRHRCTLAEAAERLEGRELDEAASRARQVDLERQLEELGEVNLMAIEEYAGMEERFNFLSSQKDDLEASLHDLQQAIQKINRTTRKRFLETFNLVNDKFREVFPRLFCGGKAELKLTDEQDLLETGIEIIVQPPGKKLANVMLMSGGEKALTAVALIFSIFLIKPTPFCLLDEVDAPLDDANIGRFNEMVREMSAISQFIIITHNKATMGVADTLYGITMEEPGASKTVSVRLNI